MKGKEYGSLQTSEVYAEILNFSVGRYPIAATKAISLPLVLVRQAKTLYIYIKLR